MLGRPRIAQEIHQRNGSYAINPSRENKHAPTIDGKEPDMPEYFNEDECRKWIELCVDLKRNGILSRDTRELLAIFCTHYGCMMRVRRLLEKTGPVLVDIGKDGKPDMKTMRRNPLAVELHKHLDAMARLLPEIGRAHV